VVSGVIDPDEQNRIVFVNIPAQCVIRIYTIAGELVTTLEHDDGSGDQAWGSRATFDQFVSRFSKRPSPGIYVYQVESRVPGSEGEEFFGKLGIIR
jgi:hypothetical protein